MTGGDLLELARAARMVAITAEDREEFDRSLILQGYEPHCAARMAGGEILDNDGALQMLARHRIRYSMEAQTHV